jgi:hypothetical protein
VVETQGKLGRLEDFIIVIWVVVVPVEVALNHRRGDFDHRNLRQSGCSRNDSVKTPIKSE